MDSQVSYPVGPRALQPVMILPKPVAPQPLVIQPQPDTPQPLVIQPQPADTQTKRSRRRARTMFEPSAIERLNEVFEEEPYPDVSLRESLSQELSVPEARIQTWFQNKRNRTRRTLKEECPSTLTKQVPAKRLSDVATRPAKRFAAEPEPTVRAGGELALGGPCLPAPLDLSAKPRPAPLASGLFRPWSVSPPANQDSPASSPEDSGISSDDSHFVSPPPVQRKVTSDGTPLFKRRVGRAMFTGPGSIPLPSPGPSPLTIFSPMFPSPSFSPFLGSSPFTPGFFSGAFQFPMFTSTPTETTFQN